MHPDILALYGRSFRAQLYLNSARGLKPLRLSRSDDSFSWTGIAEDDWLQVGSDGHSPVMDFVFRHSSSDRLYFDITLPGPPRDSTEHWRTAFNLKNLFDRRYYAGGLAQAVAAGDERTALMSVAYSF